MTGAVGKSFELGPIRPPNEAFSLLIRVTRNCPWNRCRFCPVYKGTKFSLRTVGEVKGDIDAAGAIRDEIKNLAQEHGGNIREAAAGVYRGSLDDGCRNVALWMYAGGRHAFLQDANTLIVKTPELAEIIGYLKKVFPEIDRITSYARSHTVARRTPGEMEELRRAGLSRIHIGLESGCDPVLEFLDKGVTAADQIKAGRNVVAAGISLCEYVMPGAGGRKWWREHALATAEVLNAIGPDYIRLRTLAVREGIPLHNDVLSGEFVRQTDEEVVAEIGLMLENLACPAQFVSDHMLNLLPEVEGKLPEDREKMMAVIRRFQALPPEERDVYKLGRRLGLISRLDDVADAGLRARVESVKAGLSGDDGDELLFGLTGRYV